jgi:predicted nucleotidyltransferase
MDPQRAYNLAPEKRAQVRERLTAELSLVPGIAFAYLYGSFGERRAFHDVDLGVYFRPLAPEAARGAIELANRLSLAVGLPVDVRILNDAPTSFRFHVLRGQLLVARDRELLAQVLEDTARRYLDIAPLLRLATREAFAG